MVKTFLKTFLLMSFVLLLVVGLFQMSLTKIALSGVMLLLHDFIDGKIDA